MAVVLCEETECNSGHRVVGPRFVQAAEEQATVLKIINISLYLSIRNMYLITRIFCIFCKVVLQSSDYLGNKLTTETKHE